MMQSPMDINRTGDGIRNEQGSIGPCLYWQHLLYECHTPMFGKQYNILCEQYINDLNIQNPLGFKGQVAVHLQF